MLNLSKKTKNNMVKKCQSLNVFIYGMHTAFLCYEVALSTSVEKQTSAHARGLSDSVKQMEGMIFAGIIARTISKLNLKNQEVLK